MILSLHNEATLAVEAAETSISFARDSLRDHEVTVASGYEALELASTRLAQLLGTAAGLTADESPVGQAVSKLMRLAADAKVALATARQALTDAALSFAATADSVVETSMTSPPLMLMHKAVQDAISSVAAAGECSLGRIATFPLKRIFSFS